MKRILIKDTIKKTGEKLTVSGWVNVRRDHGKIIFIDLRDASGFLQIVFIPNNKELYKIAETLRPEWVVSITGTVNKRPDKMVNKNIATGMVEMLAEEIEVLNEAETPPFEIDNDGYDVNEEARLRYRYIDLRRNRMQKNIRNRHNIAHFIRDFYKKEGFIEVETPILTKSTPEGARDYIIPSRLENGKFYALPQSPQQYKQLLMSANFEKYFQIARCFRDEDTRGDRQPEFTQVDMEMSFVEQEDVMSVNEKMITELVKTLYPEKEIQKIPFPRITYKEAMKKYGSDGPDLRKDKNNSNELAFCWVIDFPFFEKTDDGNWTFTHNPFSAPQSEYINDLESGENIGNILAAQYDLVLNGNEIAGGSIRNHKPGALKKVFEIMGYESERIDKNFGHMLKALASGTPPHGGIAFGFDRLVMLLQGEPNIREVIPFAKTGEGKDLMMNAPSEIFKEQLRELGITVVKPKN